VEWIDEWKKDACNRYYAETWTEFDFDKFWR
jgi:hypothetical protein